MENDKTRSSHEPGRCHLHPSLKISLFEGSEATFRQSSGPLSGVVGALERKEVEKGVLASAIHALMLQRLLFENS